MIQVQSNDKMYEKCMVCEASLDFLGFKILTLVFTLVLTRNVFNFKLHGRVILWERLSRLPHRWL